MARSLAVMMTAALVLSACSQSGAPVAGLEAAAAKPDTALGRCQGANWHATGYQHGISGFSAKALKALSATCEGVGVKVNRLAYSTGRLEGLTLFCTPENGYARAVAGQPPKHNCPPALAKDFEAGYANGLAKQG